MSRKDIVFFVLTGFFIANAIIGEMIGGKLIQIGIFTMSIGIIPWPVVFLTTDLINEYFGKDGVRKITFLTVGLIIYSFIVLYAGMSVGSAPFSPVSSEQFNAVFGQSMWIIVGSITAFLLSQLIDVFVFWMVRKRTGHKLIWLRATGSTVVSQLIDTFVVSGIAFFLPGKLSLAEYLNVAFTGYVFKFIIALAVTPLIYAGHAAVHRFLGESESEKLIEQASKATIGKE